MENKDALDLCLKVERTFRDELKKTYGWNNGVVSFYTENGDYYVTPFCHDVKNYLESIGYVESGLMVVYDYSYPYIYDPANGIIEGYTPGETVYFGGPSDKEEAKKWYQLCEFARKRNQEIRDNLNKERYNKKAEQMGLQNLGPEIYALCFNVPKNGMDVRVFGQKSRTFPISDDEIEKNIGKYTINNGKLAFIDSNGEKFVTPLWKEVESQLLMSGYTRGSLSVPLSNGEELLDPEYASIWQNLCEQHNKKIR